MVSSITFETAAFADVIKKAARIAPTKGAAFDKAAGLVIEFNPESSVPLAMVRVTNLDIFSIEWVNVAQWSGEAAQWRLPSFLLAQVVGSLPIGSGKQVTMFSESTEHSMLIHLQSGRTVARFHVLDIDYYPEWGAFDPDRMFPVKDLGGRLDQVEWAAGKSDPRLAGVYLDGKVAIATDTYRLACVPLSIPDLKEPIVVPAGLLGQTLRHTGEIKIGVENQMLQIMPDDYTQMKSVIYDVQYPGVTKIVNAQYDTQVQLKRDDLLAVMSRINSFAIGDRIAAFRIFLGEEEIALYMANEEVGTIGDVLEVPGNAQHPRFELKFTPKNIMEALQKSPNNGITLMYNAGDPKTLVHIDGGSGYRAWAVPRIGESKSE